MARIHAGFMKAHDYKRQLVSGSDDTSGSERRHQQSKVSTMNGGVWPCMGNNLSSNLQA